jgi:hypothetical protein
MDGYKRFTRVQKIKFILDNSYIKGSTKEYLNSMFYKDFFTEQIDRSINFTDYLKENLNKTIAYTEYVAEQNFIQKKV